VTSRKEACRFRYEVYRILPCRQVSLSVFEIKILSRTFAQVAYLVLFKLCSIGQACVEDPTKIWWESQLLVCFVDNIP